MKNKIESDIQNVRVLVLEGFARQTLPVVECLHNDGCFVATYNSSKLDVGYSSKYPDKKYLKFWDRSDEDASYNALIDFLKTEKFDVVLPMTDFSAIMLSKHKQELLQYTRPNVNDWDVFVNACDKQKTMEICQKIGIACPKTIKATFSLQEAKQQISNNLCYPIVIKPRTSYGSIGFHLINNDEQLENLYDECHQKHGDLMVQEYIPQTDCQYMCHLFIDKSGVTKASQVLKKTRWYPIDGGACACGEAVDRQDIVMQCEKLLKAIGWIGYAQIDMISDPRDNTIKFLEINPRATGPIKIAPKAGIDFIKQMVELETDKPITAFDKGKIGVRIRNMHTDILWFIGSKNRFRTTPAWFNFKNTYDQIWNIKDPLPWFTYTIQGLKKFHREKQKRKR